MRDATLEPTDLLCRAQRIDALSAHASAALARGRRMRLEFVPAPFRAAIILVLADSRESFAASRAAVWPCHGGARRPGEA